MKITAGAFYHLTELLPEQVRDIEERLRIPNPKYQDALRLGRYARNIPVQLPLYWAMDSGLALPRGLDLTWLCPSEIKNETLVNPCSIPCSITLRDYQALAVDKAFEAGGGLIVAPTGAGKTAMGIALASRLSQRTLIIVRSLDLARQWQHAILQFTGLECGVIGGGRWKEGDQFTVALVQTLSKQQQVLQYGLLLADEAHNIPAQQAYAVINRQTARYRYGLSATPQRRDRLEAMIHAVLGPVVAQIDADAAGGAVLPVRVSVVEYPFAGDVDGWSEFLQQLAEDPVRNTMIAHSAIKAAQSMGTVVLTATIAHAEALQREIELQAGNALLLHGQLPKAERLERMALAPVSSLIVSTLSLLSEGIDLPHLGAIVFASPVSADVEGRESAAATRLIQSIGRTRRPYPGKSVAHVMDVVDMHPMGLSAFRKRSEVYRQQGFLVRALPGRVVDSGV